MNLFYAFFVSLVLSGKSVSDITKNILNGTRSRNKKYLVTIFDRHLLFISLDTFSFSIYIFFRVLFYEIFFSIKFLNNFTHRIEFNFFICLSWCTWHFLQKDFNLIETNFSRQNNYSSFVKELIRRWKQVRLRKWGGRFWSCWVHLIGVVRKLCLKFLFFIIINVKPWRDNKKK